MSAGLQLVMSQGPSPGRAFTIELDSSTLGRDPTNQIVIDEAQVSRLHARVVLREGTLVIEDMGSTNGTFVNGVRLTGSQPLTPGDVIGLGESVTLTLYSGASLSSGAADFPPPPQDPIRAVEPPIPQPPGVPDYSRPGPERGTERAPAAAVPASVDERDWEEEGGARRRQYLYIGCGCLALVLTCVAVSLFLWYAPASFWDFLVGLRVPIPPNPF